ncbi:MAG: DUF853 family protein [Myxococcales bacterium]|nr:DUF853 family protein [Myxococcales bacterium]
MPPESAQQDLRLAAFCSRSMPELFHGVEHTYDVWRADPFHVPEIHDGARTRFERLVAQAHEEQTPSGRLMLLQGEPGSGKTHLMRAFRNHVHGSGQALFAYMQMTSTSKQYDRYILQKLIESLEQPYNPPEQPESSLRMLSRAMLDHLPDDTDAMVRQIESSEDHNAVIDELADQLVDILQIPSVDVDLCRALLLLQLDRPSVTRRVVKFLRAEPLSTHDRVVLGGMPPRNEDDDAPLRIIGQLRILTRVCLSRALVVCADQLEDIYNLDEAADRFAHAMTVLKTVAELPGTVVVVSCLEEFYEQLKVNLTRSIVDRLEQDPPPTVLTGTRTADDIRQLLSKRLEHLYDTQQAPFDLSDPIYPFMEAQLHLYAGQTTRQVLNECLRFREAAIELRRLPNLSEVNEIHEAGPRTSTQADSIRQLQQEWNDFKSGKHAVPESDELLVEVLESCIVQCGQEIGGDVVFATDPDDETHVLVHTRGFAEDPMPMLVALCERDPGDGLETQLARAVQAAGMATCVLVRSAAFARGISREADRLVSEVVEGGGRSVVVEDADWRHMVALGSFQRIYRGDTALFRAFVKAERPLSQLASLRAILGLDELYLPASDAPPRPPETDEQPRPSKLAHLPRPSNPTPIPPAKPLLVGTEVLRGTKVTLGLETFGRHVALLGDPGSGKTTAALNLVEQLLAREVPAILVDRRGDLCGFAAPGVMGPEVDVSLYTPGHPGGRSLEVPIAPRGLALVPPPEQEAAIRVASGALADTMTSSRGVTAQRKRAALHVALKMLASHSGTSDLKLPALAEFLKENNASLLAQLGGLGRFVDEVAVDLQVLMTTKGDLMGTGCEPLDADTLLGPSPAGKTRLSVMTTRFLPSHQDVQFWVTQLLFELERWLLSHPAPTRPSASAGDLRGVLLLDEAEIYMPVSREPSTKQQLLALLRRARSGGLAVILLTRSPLELDLSGRDNVRTWFVGGIAERSSVGRLDDLLAENGTDGTDVPEQEVGSFHVLMGKRTVRVNSNHNQVRLPEVSENEVLDLAARGRTS